MGNYTKSYSKMFFKGLHYIVAWFKSEGHCWFCGTYTWLEPLKGQAKTCFSVKDKDSKVELDNVIIVCDMCAATRKYKTVEEYRQYAYTKDVVNAVKEGKPPGDVKKRKFWGEENAMDYSILKKLLGDISAQKLTDGDIK